MVQDDVVSSVSPTSNRDNRVARRRRGMLAALLASAIPWTLSGPATGQSMVLEWGDNYYGQCDVPQPPPGLDYVEIAPGGHYTVARLSDGSLAAWGLNQYGQCNVPAPPPGQTYIQIASGFFHSIGRLSDGSVVAWGDNGAGQCEVPPAPPGLSYVEVSAGQRHTIARLGDGSVVAWGLDQYGQSNVPAPPAGQTYVEIDAGIYHNVARLSNGSAVAWGHNNFGQCDVPAPPPGQSYVEVSAGGDHTVGRLSDGSVVAWGDNKYGQCDVPALATYTEIGAGTIYTAARVEDPLAVTYCTAGTSASGCYAWLFRIGIPSASAPSGFDLLAMSVEGQKAGVLFYGVNGRQAQSWGNSSSFRCVLPPVRRAGLLLSTGTQNSCDGVFTQDLNEHWATHPSPRPSAGTLVQAQVWYRDPKNTSNQTTSLSNAIEFTVAP